MLNDPEVVRASEEFVRIIIRRPHAYFVLDEWFKDQGGCVSATPEGMVLGDGGTVPLPGLYVLNAEGVVVTSAGLVGEDARSTLLKALRIE